jgi:hypothetical protein
VKNIQRNQRQNKVTITPETAKKIILLTIITTVSFAAGYFAAAVHIAAMLNN